jgi:TorA-specific chaperone
MNEWRIDVWRWLAGLFAAPLAAAAVESYRHGEGGAYLRALRRLPALQPGIERMAHALQLLPPGAAAAAQLARAYTLLFSGVGGPATVPPYQSAFTEASGRLFGSAEGEMRGLLAKLDLHIAACGNEPADHLATELAVMAELIAAAPWPEQRDFLDRLLAWIPAFSEACVALDRSGFYAGAALVLAGFLRLQSEAGETVASALHNQFCGGNA